MPLHRIYNWDEAYANSAHIADGARWPAIWEGAARSYRDELNGAAILEIDYGPRPRNKLDLFMPESRPNGLVVFVHGGYWLDFDRKYWSHLAQGSVERGFAVAVPSYTLCPDARIADITREIAAAIERAAAQVPGPIFLTGHSAGGHLVARMITLTSPLGGPTRSRVRNTVSISGLHDLRPLTRTSMAVDLRLDGEEASAESPALLEPIPDARLVCWVGATERPEFIRQSSLLANIWRGLGTETGAFEEPDRHHFNIIDGLADPQHALVKALLCD